jgi:glutamine phosphoribosylpyrophosphate amidotransferase
MEEFLKNYEEDIEMYGVSMRNAYDLITNKRNLDDIYEALEEDALDVYPLPFNPLEEDGRSRDIIDILIEYFTETEEYEKCAELVKIKDTCPRDL